MKELLPPGLRSFGIAALIAVTAFAPMPLYAHCQVPCGIYDDHARIEALAEDAATVIKAAKMMNELSDKTDLQSRQQFTRWVLNKEQHAQKIITTLADYFLTQRVKPSQSDYGERIANHHAVILAAMKAKQKSDVASADALLKAIQVIAAYYPEHHHKH